MSKPGPRQVFALWLSMLCLVSSASADEVCFNDPDGPLPTTVTFDTGDVVTVLNRDGPVMTYRAVISGTPMEMTVRDGIFTLRSQRMGDVSTFNWTTPLPDLSMIAVGDVYDAQAIVTHSTRPARVYTVQFLVMGVETYRIGACLYPVHRVRQRISTAGGENIFMRYLHAPSGMTLKSFAPLVSGRWQQHLAIALD